MPYTYYNGQNKNIANASVLVTVMAKCFLSNMKPETHLNSYGLKVY